jgi:hypothetical protein
VGDPIDRFDVKNAHPSPITSPSRGGAGSDPPPSQQAGYGAARSVCHIGPRHLAHSGPKIVYGLGELHRARRPMGGTVTRVAPSRPFAATARCPSPPHMRRLAMSVRLGPGPIRGRAPPYLTGGA